MVDYWKKFNESKPFATFKAWFMGLPSTWRALLTYIIAMIVMITLLFAIPSPGAIGKEYKIPSYEEVMAKWKTVSYDELMKKWHAFGVKIKEETEYPITVENLMCSYIYQYNMTNSTWGGTTCFKWEDSETYDCMCITPVE